MKRQKWLFIFVFLSTVMARGEDTPRLVFLGDSLTAGYTLDVDLAYPALIQKKIDEADLNYRVINSGISGDTTAGGLRRLDWLLRQRVDMLVIALGANDGLRGLPVESAEQNLDAMIKKVREKSPGTIILLAGMVLPENMGSDYKTQFDGLYARVAGRNQVPLMPFILEGVATDPDLNLPDGLHPNEQGHRIMADNMWAFIRPHLPGSERPE